MNFLDVQRQWRNRFPQNPVQTQGLRFFKQPGTELKTMFSDIEEKFNRQFGNDKLETIYSDMWKLGEGGRL